MKSIVERLQERVTRLGNSGIDLNRPVISRYEHHFQYGVFEDNYPWRLFAMMQLSSLELEELRQIDAKVETIRLTCQRWPPDEARPLFDRRDKLFETAELRAEKLGEKPWRD